MDAKNNVICQRRPNIIQLGGRFWIFFFILLLLLATNHRHLHSRFTYLSSHRVINTTSIIIIIIMIVSRQLLIFILTLLLSLLYIIIRITQSSVWLTVTSNFHTTASVSATAIGTDI